MSMVPMTYRDWWDDWDTPFRRSRIIDQHFGSGIRRDDLWQSFLNSSPPTHQRGAGYFRPWNKQLRRQDSGSTLNFDQDKFQVILDVQQFSPNEITVKCTDKHIIVEGKHDERADEHGYVFRHFVRRYQLPSGVNPNDISSALSSDGVLTITAPLKSNLQNSFERVVPITQMTNAQKTERERRDSLARTEELRSDYAD